MSQRIRSFFTYIVVLAILLAMLSVISPAQFEALANAFSQSAQLILVLIFIALIVYVLRKAERL